MLGRVSKGYFPSLPLSANPSFDALAGMKKLNDWPTFPQIIVNGELIGGLDILKVSRSLSCSPSAADVC